MKLLLPTVLIAVLYGTYDFFIKLSADKISPALGALFTQLSSVFTIFVFIVYQVYIYKSFQLKADSKGLLLAVIAGVLIGLALVSLFFLMQSKEIKITSILPAILTLRNLTLITLGILILKENLTFVKAIGILLSIIGIYLIFI